MATTTDRIADKMVAEVAQVEKVSLDPNSDKSDLDTSPIDPVMEKKLLRKVDLHVVPILFLLFLCAFVDR